MKRRPDCTPEEGRELTRRLEKMRRAGGVRHEVIVQEILDDMERDLRKLVRDYDGTGSQAKELLGGLVIARESGVKACDEIELALASRLGRTD